MEAEKVCEQLKYITQAGVTLSTEERMQLEYALSTLQSSMQFETLYFWGKINGKSFLFAIEKGSCTGRLFSRNATVMLACDFLTLLSRRACYANSCSSDTM